MALRFTCVIFLTLIFYCDAWGFLRISSGGFKGSSVGKNSPKGSSVSKSYLSSNSGYSSRSSSRVGYNPPISASVYTSPSFGQIAKEAAVSSVVTAGVNRMIPGGIYGTWGAPWGWTHPPMNSRPSPEEPKNSDAPVKSSSPDAAGFTTWSGRNVTLTEFQALTELLLTKDYNNAARFITMNLQGQKIDNSTDDIAPERLLTVNDEAWSIPTVKAVLDLLDNYNMDVHVKEVATDQRAKEENAFLDLIWDTDIMSETITFLVDNGYVKNDRAECKKTLRDIWFWQFGRTDGDAGSSGFEAVFLPEKFDSDIIGMHNWIYYARMEANGTLNYLGYIGNLTLDGKGDILKVRSSLNGIVQPVTSIFVGTSPELEIALYTLCFYALPNYPCPIKLAGKDVVIMVNAYRVDNKNITASAYPDLWPNSAPAQMPLAILGVNMCLLISVLILNPLNMGFW